MVVVRFNLLHVAGHVAGHLSYRPRQCWAVAGVAGVACVFG